MALRGWLLKAALTIAGANWLHLIFTKNIPNLAYIDYPTPDSAIGAATTSDPTPKFNGTTYNSIFACLPNVI